MPVYLTLAPSSGSPLAVTVLTVFDTRRDKRKVSKAAALQQTERRSFSFCARSFPSSYSDIRAKRVHHSPTVDIDVTVVNPVEFTGEFRHWHRIKTVNVLSSILPLFPLFFHCCRRCCVEICHQQLDISRSRLPPNLTSVTRPRSISHDAFVIRFISFRRRRRRAVVVPFVQLEGGQSINRSNAN